MWAAGAVEVESSFGFPVVSLSSIGPGFQQLNVRVLRIIPLRLNVCGPLRGVGGDGWKEGAGHDG